MDAPIAASAISGKIEELARDDAAEATETLLYAAKGDDDLMSQQPQARGAEWGSSSWKDQIGRAQRIWGRLSRVDLAIVDGDMGKLSGLLRRHYSFRDAEIDRQIIEFLGGKG